MGRRAGGGGERGGGERVGRERERGGKGYGGERRRVREFRTQRVFHSLWLGSQSVWDSTRLPNHNTAVLNF
jgi:hypothetical protein